MRRLLLLLASTSLLWSFGACSPIGLGCDLVIAAIPGDVVPVEGDVLDPDWPVIAGLSDIDPANTKIVSQGDVRTLTLALRPPAAGRMGAFTAASVGSFIAIGVDGRVALVPVIQAAIPDGQVLIDISQGEGDVVDGQRRLEQCVSSI